MSTLTKLCRGAITGGVLLVIWQAAVIGSEVPAYLLPSPWQVATAWIEHVDVLWPHTLTTATEVLLGLVLGTVLGMLSALTMTRFRSLRRWLLPVLVISQALPVFALAPLLVLWLGYGMASKVAMAVLIIYFPVTASCYDGLRHTPPDWIDLARTMNASSWAVLWQMRLPAALPALGSGLRIAAAVAPIGAVIGEWVGSSQGLGYLMLHANARMQIDLMFAALFNLAVFALVLFFGIEALLRRGLRWHPETLSLSH